MKLRDRQVDFVERCIAALDEHGNTIGVAPTGAGKTVMLGGIAGRVPGQTLVLQHRDELVKQNRNTFSLVNPKKSSGLYTADRKEWGYDATFAMVQTLSNNLDDMPPVEFLAVDEGHHAAATSYRKIIQKAQDLNPKLKLLLLTATPNRGDKKALRGVVSNCADQIMLKELIDAGHLVPPRTMVIDLGVREALSTVRKSLADFDMDAVAAIMDKTVLNDKIVEAWKAHAADRQTVIFGSTVEHAQHVAEAFVQAGISAVTIEGTLSKKERAARLDAYDRGEIRVIVNVAVLTEGWDHQPTACVILLRPSSYKSTMIQMIGRGLRKVDPERYPGRRKDDCIVMDFGTSLLTHGGIEQDTNIDQEGTKSCPDCDATVPRQARDCAICGHEFPLVGEAPIKVCEDCGHENYTAVRTCIKCGWLFPEKERGELGDFVLTEISLFEASPFKWEAIGNYAGVENEIVMCAAAFEAWAMCVHYYGRWHAFGGVKGKEVRHLLDTSERLAALASADDFLREEGDSDAGSKSRSWLYMPATERQAQMLRTTPGNLFGTSRYRASCMLTWVFNNKAIRSKLEQSRMMAA
jgi:DNA repair protein RadD